MSNSSTEAKIISAHLIKNNKRDLVAKKICTMEPEGEIKGKGSVVKFVGLSDPTVKKYEGSIEYDDIKDGSVLLQIDQQDYVAFTTDDIKKFFDSVDKKGNTVSRAAHKMQSEADAYILGIGADEAKHQMVITSCTPKQSIKTLLNIDTKLGELDVPKGEKFIVIPHWMKNHLTLGGIEFQLLNGVDDTKNGVDFANYANLDLYVSNNLKETRVNDIPTTKIVAGEYNSIVFADAFTESRYLPLTDKFANGYSALHVYGGKVVNPDRVICVTATKADDEEV